MKKNVSGVLLSLVSTIVFSQSIAFWREQTFLIANDYEIIDDCNAYEFYHEKKEFIKTETIIEKGYVVSSEVYERFWGINMLRIENKNFIDTPDYKIAENDSFPAQSVYSIVNEETCDRWVPEWYFYALEEMDRNLIAEAEPKRKTWDADILPDVWYKDIPQVSSFVLTNAGMTMYTPLSAQAIFIFQSLKKDMDGKFEAIAYPEVSDTDSDVFWEPNKENFPALKNGNPVKFRFEINGKEMKIYNGETGKLCLDLIQMPAEWVALYEEDFIRANTIPAGLYLPEEYLKRKNGSSLGGDVHVMEHAAESAIPKPAPAAGKTATVTENLRLRTDDTATAEVVTTLAAGTRVKVLAPGREDTIDGIASSWVQVKVLGDAKDKDGNAIERGTAGWLFGGYLSEAEESTLPESAESERPDTEAAAAKEALPIVPVAAGIAALAVLLAVVLLAARRRKGSKE